MPGMRGSRQERSQRIAGINAVLHEDWANAFDGQQKDSVRKETITVSATKGLNVKNGHRKPSLPQIREQKKMSKHLPEKSL